ncbi:MAG TPA: cbb3-type cytochrome oxidase assembly protein [Planctomycetaceae bacterium]|nr:cbb3-type cytochrome oxidase assembly protein [Planctomycetaceae bacterium]
MKPSAAARRRTLVVWIFAIVIFVPCALGFGLKFLELIHLSRGNFEGRFALTPVVNYLLATLGFVCLFIWAALRGTFHDVEAAKERMLATERLIDEASAEPPPSTGERRISTAGKRDPSVAVRKGLTNVAT